VLIAVGTTKAIECSRLRWTEHVSCVEEDKRILARPRHRRKDDVRIDLIEWGEWIGLI